MGMDIIMMTNNIIEYVQGIRLNINYIEEDSKTIVMELNCNNNSKAMLKLNDLLKQMLNIIDGMIYLAQNGYFSDKTDDIQDFNLMLKEMVEALSNEDYVSISDMLQGDFIIYLNNIKNLLDDILNVC